METALNRTNWRKKLGKNTIVNTKVVNPNVSAVDAISGLLAGKLPENYDAKALREERLSKYAPDD